MRKSFWFASAVCIATFCLTAVGCGGCQNNQGVSRGGVKIAEVHVETDKDGHTVEQKNIMERLKIDNQPGGIKHLYVFSPVSGQCLIYSTVKGKVTSGGKRLSPYSVVEDSRWNGTAFFVKNQQFRSTEFPQEDGTFGTSASYIFWFDQRGVYHQHYVTDGQIIHISTEPMPIKSVVVNVEEVHK